MRILTNLITFITAEKRTPASGIKKKVPEKQIGSTCSIYSLINCQNNQKEILWINLIVYIDCYLAKKEKEKSWYTLSTKNL